MNAILPTGFHPAAPQDGAAGRRRERPQCRLRRMRAYGVGYGRTVGYAGARRYVDDWTLSPFRCT